MNIQHLSIRNFRNFESWDISFDENLTLIVGANGAGKTTLMDAVAVSLGTVFTALDGLAGVSINKQDARLSAFQLGSGEDVQAAYPVVISAEGMMDGHTVHWERSLNGEKGSTTVKNAQDLIRMIKSYQDRLRAGDRLLALPIIAYYGTGRLWDYHRAKKTNTFKTNTRTNGYMDCLDGTTNAKLMLDWFRQMEFKRFDEDLKSLPELTAVYGAMETCLSRAGYVDAKIHYNPKQNELFISYDAEGGRIKLPLNQLSDGYKVVSSLIADIAYRMAVLNPQYLDRVTQETDGIVLIDEIDLHLHPAWQQRILLDLREIFPKVQFIVSTHAPAVIHSTTSEHLRILNDNRLEMPAMQSFGKDANSILKSIMGVSERPLQIVERFKSFYELLDNEKYDDAEHILDLLEEDIGEDPEIAYCRVQLDLERRSV